MFQSNHSFRSFCSLEHTCAHTNTFPSLTCLLPGALNLESGDAFWGISCLVPIISGFARNDEAGDVNGGVGDSCHGFGGDINLGAGDTYDQTLLSSLIVNQLQLY